MALPDGWQFGDPCPVCGGAVDDLRGQPKRGNSPDARCTNVGVCNSGGVDKYGAPRPWAAWIQSRQQGQRPPQQPQRAPQQRQPQQAPARPQAQPQGAAPRQQVSFDAALAAGREAVISIGGALHDLAKNCGIGLDSDPQRAAWFQATASVVCSYVIALSDGRLRLGPAEPEPAKPVSAHDKYREALRMAPDAKAISRIVMGLGGDAALTGDEKQALAEYANECLDTISMVGEMN